MFRFITARKLLKIINIFVSVLSLCFMGWVSASVSADIKLDNNVVQPSVEINNKLLKKHLNEWNLMKPALQRLIKSEQDIIKIVAALEKTSAVKENPSAEQLLQANEFIPPKKTNPIDEDNKVKPLKIDSAAEVKKQKKIGIHLASYKNYQNAVRGWFLLKEKFNKELDQKKPFSQKVTINNTVYIRLLAGNFESIEVANLTCDLLKNQQQYCRIVTY